MVTAGGGRKNFGKRLSSFFLRQNTNGSNEFGDLQESNIISRSMHNIENSTRNTKTMVSSGSLDLVALCGQTSVEYLAHIINEVNFGGILKRSGHSSKNCIYAAPLKPLNAIIAYALCQNPMLSARMHYKLIDDISDRDLRVSGGNVWQRIRAISLFLFLVTCRNEVSIAFAKKIFKSIEGGRKKAASAANGNSDDVKEFVNASAFGNSQVPRDILTQLYNAFSQIIFCRSNLELAHNSLLEDISRTYNNINLINLIDQYGETATDQIKFDEFDSCKRLKNEFFIYNSRPNIIIELLSSDEDQEEDDKEEQEDEQESEDSIKNNAKNTNYVAPSINKDQMNKSRINKNPQEIPKERDKNLKEQIDKKTTLNKSVKGENIEVIDEKEKREMLNHTLNKAEKILNEQKLKYQQNEENSNIPNLNKVLIRTDDDVKIPNYENSSESNESLYQSDIDENIESILEAEFVAMTPPGIPPQNDLEPQNNRLDEINIEQIRNFDRELESIINME